MIPIVLISLAYTIGAFWGLYLNFCLGVAFFCLLVCVLIFIKLDKKYRCYFLLLLFLFSLCYTKYRDNLYLCTYKNGEINMICKVISDIKEEEYFDVYTIGFKKGKFILYLEKGFNKIDFGSIISINGNLELPKGQRNSGGFNYRRYLNSQNIYGLIKVKNKNINIIELPKNDFIHKTRTEIIKSIAKTLPKSHYALLVAMLIGDTSNISEETANSFKRSGISHILAVSGTNVAYVILFSKFIFDKIFGRRYSNYLIILFSVFYMYIAGNSPSVIRATIMAIVLVISEIISRKYNIISSLAFSALILLLINPLVICDVGFILSFGGTIGIALLNSNIQISIKKYIKIKLLSETLSVTISALIILTPITILYFNTLSIVAIITNIIAVPIAGVITIIGFLLVIFGQISFHISVLLSYSIYILLSLIIVSSSFLSKLPFSNILLTTPKVSTILIYYYIIYRIYKGNFNKKVLYVILLYIFILFIFNLLPRPYVELNFIDVGQGDCCLIQTKHNKTILIDGGGSDSSNFDVGENIVLPYILDKGISRIDLMVLSHPHDDHIEGLITILNNLKVKELIISSLIIPNEKYTELINIARDKNVKISYVSLGDNIYLDGIRFIVIHPKNPLTDINDNSLILKFEYEKASALFTGDISSIVENTLKIGAIDILKVAHHGSSKSSSLDFISNVKPKLSIISVGVNNYGQPNKDVINNLSKFSIPVCTKDNGEINIKLYKNGLIKYTKCIN